MTIWARGNSPPGETWMQSASSLSVAGPGWSLPWPEKGTIAAWSWPKWTHFYDSQSESDIKPEKLQYFLYIA